MRLILRPTQCPTGLTIVEGSFGADGGTIGRGSDCTFPLPDPQRSISRAHAEIRHNDGHFYVKVISKVNPVLVNGSAVTHNQMVQISAGDNIEIGDYRFVVELHDGSAAVGAKCAPVPDVFEVFDSQEGHDEPTDPAEKPDPFSLAPEERDGPGNAVGSGQPPPAIWTDVVAVKGNLAVDRFLKVDPYAVTRPRGAEPDQRIGARADHVEDINLPFSAPGRVDKSPERRPAADIFSVLDDASNVQPERQTPVPPIDLIAHFAEGAGLHDMRLSPAEASAFMREIGRVLRIAVTGTHALLVLRAEVKKELRAGERTMIASRENNPLKHTASGEEAFRYLFEVRNRDAAFLPPDQAMQDAFDDIRAHEIAVMAGMRAGVAGVLKRFAPERLEKRIRKSGALDPVLPSLYKAKLWETYVELFSDIEGETGDHFDRLFGTEFARAYVEQAKTLKRTRSA